MATKNRPRLGFIGPGTVGTALAHGLAEAGYSIVLHGRNPERLRRALDRVPGARRATSAQEVVDSADVVFLTVPDDAIRSVAASLDWSPEKSAVHCSGASSFDPVEPATARGAAVGVLHPLQSFASPEQAEKNLPGSAFAVQATEPDLETTLAEMARALGGSPFVLAGDKAVYHASAVIACNYLVTLLDAAADLWRHLGLTKQDGLRALLPLVRGTVENLEAVGLPNALTGPIARGDVGTVDRHLAALREFAPDLALLYTELARRTISVALDKGTLDEAAARRLRERLEKG